MLNRYESAVKRKGSPRMTIKNDPETLAAARKGAGLVPPPEERKPADLVGQSLFLYSGDRVGKVEAVDQDGRLVVTFDPN